MIAQFKKNSFQANLSRGSVVTGILCGYTILQFFLQGALSVMSFEVKKAFNIDAASISLLSSSFFYSYILLQVPVGLILDKFGMYKTCLISLVFMGLSCVVFASTSNFQVALISRFLTGVGASFGFISMLRSIKIFFPSEKFILVMSIAEFIGMIGAASCNIFFSYLTDSVGWRFSIFFATALCFVLATLWFHFGVDSDQSEEATSQAQKPEKLRTFHILQKVFSYRPVWFNGLYAGFLYSLITVFVSLWGIPYTEKLYSISTTEAAFLISFVYVGLGFSSLFMSLIVSFFEIKMAVRFLTFMCLVFVSWYIYFPPSHILFAYVLLFLAGASCSVYQLAFSLVGQNVSKSIQSTAGGVTNMFCMAGAPVLQPLVGFALSLTQTNFMDGFESYSVNQYRAAFLVLVLCLAFAFLFSWFIFPQHRDSKLHQKVKGRFSTKTVSPREPLC